jgi:hypothetical protein
MINNMITIRINKSRDAQEMPRHMLSDYVRKHLYPDERDFGVHAVARLFTSRMPSGGGGAR